MNRLMKKLLTLTGALLLLLALAAPAYAAAPEDGQNAAQEETEESSTGMKALAAGLAVGIAAAGGMGLATAKSAEGIARQPEAEGKIRTMMMLGLVFIETAIIYALLVVILIIFVL